MKTGIEAIADVKNKFVLDTHMKAIEQVSEELDATFSFREAGKDTLDALSRGYAAKGHNILEKTIKPSSVANAYGERAEEIMKIVRDVGLAGVVGAWGKAGIEGAYVHDRTNYTDRKMSFGIENPETQEAYREGVRNGTIKPYTGDYDMHDVMMLREGYVPVADSAVETSVKDRINKAVAEQDKERPFEEEAMNVVRHGPQVNFTAFMWEKEFDSVLKNDGYLTAVAKPGPFPLASVHKKAWTIIENEEELFDLYRRNHVLIPYHWRHDSTGSLVESEKNGFVITPRQNFLKNMLARPLAR